jgi:hypothetical protein
MNKYDCFEMIPEADDEVGLSTGQVTDSECFTLFCAENDMKY